VELRVFLTRYIDRKATAEFVKEMVQILPVAAWRISASACMPIVIRDVPPVIDGIGAIHCPSGMVHSFDGRGFKGIDAWIAVDALPAWKSWRAARGVSETPINQPIVGFGGRLAGAFFAVGSDVLRAAVRGAGSLRTVCSAGRGP
jgi:hypothetical protein